MPIRYFTPEYFFHERTENSSEIKEKLYPEIVSRLNDVTNFWPLSVVKTSYNKNNQYNNFLLISELTDFIWKTVDSMIQDPIIMSSITADSLPVESRISSIWFNSYETGNYQEIHNHVGSSAEYIDNREYRTKYSFIYLLHNESKTGTIFRSSNYDAGIKSNPTFNTAELDNFGEGSLVVFPESLDHYVLPATGNRITVTGNIIVTSDNA